jgi:hypothetical protein
VEWLKVQTLSSNPSTTREKETEREREREKPGRHHLNYMIRLSSLHDVDARYYGIQIKYHEKSTPQILTPNP